MIGRVDHDNAKINDKDLPLFQGQRRKLSLVLYTARGSGTQCVIDNLCDHWYLFTKRPYKKELCLQRKRFGAQLRAQILFIYKKQIFIIVRVSLSWVVK